MWQGSAQTAAAAGFRFGLGLVIRPRAHVAFASGLKMHPDQIEEVASIFLSIWSKADLLENELKREE